jgi:carbon-monoxide dehydrogenase large subunit
MNRVVGHSLHRIEDPPLLKGQGQYVDDIKLADVLHVAFVRSTSAHARIGRVDIEEARAMPGVHAVMTAADLKTVLTSTRMPLSASTSKGQNSSTPFVLSDKEVAYVGEPIALVVAASRHEAEDAASAVMVDYEPLPVVTDARLAVDPSSPVVRTELKSNILNRLEVEYGDIDAAFAKAAHVFQDDLLQHRGCGHSMEARGVVVEIRPGHDGICVWSSTQMPHDLFYTLADVLNLDETRLRVITPDVGGGFGPKYCLYPEEIALPAAAIILKRNLKWIEDRRENFLAAIQERDQHWSLEIATDADARILGIRGNLIHDQGAYTPKAVNLPYNSASAVPGTYIVPAYKVDVIICHTNKVPVSSVRGAGYPQAAFAMERMMDLIAAKLGLDRAEVRSRNLIPPEKMPYTKPLKARSGAGIIYDSGDYPASQKEALAAAGWADFPRRQAEALAQGRYIGIGLANAVKGTGRGPFESGVVRVSPSGRVSVFTGATAMGQGLATALAQICAEELSVEPETITVIAGDTAFTPLGLGGFASRQLVTAGSSVHIASKAVAAKAIKAASSMLDIPEAELELAGGHVRVRGGGSNLGMSLAEIATRLRGAPGYAFPADVEPGLESSIQWKTDALAYANACHVVEVEVDVEIGQVTINRYVALHDSGKLVNPMIVDGQIIGGIAHGIGNALYEQMGYDESGQPLTTTFQEYLLVTATELPHFETIYRETPSPMNPLGAKGVGEAGTIPAAAAVISAVENALTPFGVRISQTPIVPETIFNLIQKGRADMAAKQGSH